MHRMELNRLDLAPRRNGNPNLRISRSAAAPNIDRARRRWLRANACLLFEAHGPITLHDGPVLRAPSGDEGVAEAQLGPTHKRSGDTLHTPPSQLACTNSPDAGVGSGEEFRNSHGFVT